MHLLPHRHDHEEGHGHLHKSALTGILQGLGGTAALMLVTLTTVNTLEMGVGFIAFFAVGVILGMIAVVCVLGSVIAYTASRMEKVHKVIIAATGTLSIAFGVGIILSIIV